MPNQSAFISLLLLDITLDINWNHTWWLFAYALLSLLLLLCLLPFWRIKDVYNIILCLLRNECSRMRAIQRNKMLKIKALSIQTQLQHNCIAKGQHIWQSHSVHSTQYNWQNIMDPVSLAYIYHMIYWRTQNTPQREREKEAIKFLIHSYYVP